MNKKQMIAELVTNRGYVEKDIKDLKNAELERLLSTKDEVSEETQKVTEEVLDEVVEEVIEESTGEVETSEVIEPVGPVEEKVLSEYTHQMGIFNEFIYNTKNIGATLFVMNLGYGDVYVSKDEEPKVGKIEDRIEFKGARRYRDADKLRFLSGSQPVIQILEIQ